MKICKSKNLKRFIPFFRGSIKEIDCHSLKEELKGKKYSILYFKDKGKIISALLWYLKEKNAIRIRLIATKKGYRKNGRSTLLLKELERLTSGKRIISALVSLNNKGALIFFFKNKYEIHSLLIKKKKIMMVKS